MPLYVTEVGRHAGGPVVIVLHGGPGISHDYLRPEWDRLAAEGRRVVYYDQRGCGRSGDGAPYGWREDVADLDRVVRRVSPDDPVVLAGSSWGPWLALLYAHEHPERVRALVFSGMPPRANIAPTTSDPAAWRRLLLASPAADGFARADSVNRGIVRVRRTHPDSAAQVPNAGPTIAARLARPPQLECPDASRARALLFHDIPPDSALAVVPVPALFVWGDRDWTYQRGGRALAERVPNARVVVLAGLGHDPWLDAPDLFFVEVDAFLKAVAPEER